MEAFLKRRATSPKRQPKQQSRLIKALTNPQMIVLRIYRESGNLGLIVSLPVERAAAVDHPVGLKHDKITVEIRQIDLTAWHEQAPFNERTHEPMHVRHIVAPHAPDALILVGVNHGPDTEV